MYRNDGLSIGGWRGASDAGSFYEPTVLADVTFGGTRFSGMGRASGAEGIADDLDTKRAQVVF